MRKRAILTAVAFASLWAALPAMAAATQTATTGAATAVAGSAATLNAVVNPEGNSVQYAFEWGPTSSYGEETTLTSVSGTSNQAVTAALSGLQPGTSYHFRVITLSSAGTVTGSDKSFTTTGYAVKPAGTAPAATSAAATSVTTAGATLNGSVNPEGTATNYYFQYGKTSAYGYQTTALGAGSGATASPVTATLSGLSANTTYDYRLVAVSGAGVAVGANMTFTTYTVPTVTSGAASAITTDSVTFNGEVNPEGHTTAFSFQYGKTKSYGATTTATSAGDGTVTVEVTAVADGLAANTTYHYRLVAESAGGTVYGPDQTFTTLALPAKTSILKLVGPRGWVSRQGVASFVAVCKGTAVCRGSAALRVRGKLIGSARYRLAAGNAGVLAIRLNARGKRLLRHVRAGGTLRASVAVTYSKTGRTTGTVRLIRFS